MDPECLFDSWNTQMVKTPEGAGELLRRVPIIALEDTLMHPALPLVVWLMAAQVSLACRGGCRSCTTADAAATQCNWGPAKCS
jgi:hypothetical protein